MSDPPTNRTEFLIRFICAAICFGIVIGLSLLAGVRGDEVWRRFLVPHPQKLDKFATISWIVCDGTSLPLGAPLHSPSRSDDRW